MAQEKPCAPFCISYFNSPFSLLTLILLSNLFAVRTWLKLCIVDIPLQRLGSITLDNVERELRPVIGVDTEAANITRNLEAVQAVLEDAESRQLKEDTVRLWWNDLTQLCYEMEDVLDENTEVQKAEWRNKKMEVKMALLRRRSVTDVFAVLRGKHFAAFGYLSVNQWITSAKGLHKHSQSVLPLVCYLCWIFYHSYSPSSSFGNGAAKRANAPMSITADKRSADQEGE
ncbi:uncharacterized protein LOC112186716 [Rosa chinensis]|uniref:uncharacterized protein LOC112186716 n=1 Tax=Rosa chinensis TaxID=74649 RepID=UPI001AD92CE0|nr:uncharacterized protein LOC112186716 [Rosa chinensis]